MLNSLFEIIVLFAQDISSWNRAQVMIIALIMVQQPFILYYIPVSYGILTLMVYLPRGQFSYDILKGKRNAG